MISKSGIVTYWYFIIRGDNALDGLQSLHEAGAYLPGKSVRSGFWPCLVIRDSETYLGGGLQTEDGVDWWITEKNPTGARYGYHRRPLELADQLSRFSKN